MHKAGENFALPYAEGLRCKLNSKLPLFFLLQSGVKSQIYKREVFMKKNRWFAVISAMVMALAVAGCSDGSSGIGNSEVYYSKYQVGDFVLKDGTILSKDSTPEGGTVAAVIVRAAADGKPALGVGIVHNQSGLSWCTKSAEGHSIEITSLTETGNFRYKDGSDGWEKLKAACPDAESNPENYPAWNYSLTYAKNNCLTGDLATGWYLPTLAELETICENKTAIDESLSKAGGSTFGTSGYWSCIQHSDEKQKHYAYLHVFKKDLLFGTEGYSLGCPKSDNSNSVCSVRAFY